MKSTGTKGRMTPAIGGSAAGLGPAIELFARAFAFTRNFTHPCLVERVGPLWVVRDAPRKRPEDYRREEWLAYGVEPSEVDRIARKHTRGRFCVCAIRASNEPEEPLRTAYRSAGYRLGCIETFMMHRLQRIPRLPEPFPVRQVVTQDLADRLAKAARNRQVLPEHLAADSPLRQYVALDGEAPVGWVRSIAVGDGRWVSNMHVLSNYRRRGIGKSMIARMLRDDRANGAAYSILLATHTGAMLYPNVGYGVIGELLLYTPKKR
jgi:GNAT superfamily N-acetyltransferase